MLNLIFSLASGLIVFALLRFTGLVPTIGAIFPAIVALVGSYFLLARRSGRQLEAIVQSAHKELAAKRPERAIEIMQSGFALARWQFLVASQLHGQIGSLLYVQKKFDEAEPHLKGAWIKIWPAKAMLAAQHYRRKEWPQMVELFEKTVASNKGEGLLYAVYAWCEEKRGEKKNALAILQRGVTEIPGDDRLKTLLSRAQNDKRMKMDAYGEQWWQFWLESPPQMQQGGFGGGGFGVRGTFGGRRGR